MPERSLEEIGLGTRALVGIYGISLLPFVGLVIGVNYAFRRNVATRRFGRRLLMAAFALHAIYLFCICPTAMFWALTR